MPNTILLNDGWFFSLDNGESHPVNIPHDWLIADANNFYKSGIGRYTRELDATCLKPGQRLSIRFDGVYMDSTLYVNGNKAGEWKYGYTAFEFDITGHIDRENKNELLLEVNYNGQSGRWYTGAGIYRDVFLITRNACHFLPDGIYVTTEKTNGVWSWNAGAEVITDGRAYEVVHTIIGAGSVIETWDITDPKLYTLRSELIVDGIVEDFIDTKIGFREIAFTADKGFFLNGRNLKIFGVCLHHDLGSLGSAFDKDAARRQLTIMREMGVNAVRTAHNPPASAFMDLCDEMGFLVMSELTDIWQRSKTPGDYARFFDRWVERDAASWIRRDRNRPSVILWSVGNEINDTHVDPEGGMATLRRLMSLVKKHDPKEHAPATLCSNYMAWENTQKCADIIKIIGYNYTERLYNDHHAAHPDWVIYGGETSSTLQSRGIYHFPLSQKTLADDDLQCSSLGNSTTSWGAESVQACIRDDFAASFSPGQFIWTGFDYIGEPTPYDTKNCYFGQVDTAGFEKDSYYIFKSAWTDHKQTPFVHLFPYWDFSPGQPVDISVCSNAPSVALFHNNTLISKDEIKNKWVTTLQIPYSPGVIRAEAYNEEGTVVAVMERYSFGDTTTLHAMTENYGMLDFITITAHDNEGRPVENANNRVHVNILHGVLLALDNGDSTDFESYKSTSRRMFNGKLLAIVRRTGDIQPNVTTRLCDNDIPIRKIELTVDSFSADDGNEYFNVSAKLFPENATYKELDWRLTDAAGINSPIGDLIVSDDGLSAKIIPTGDGICYIRCAPYNGKNHVAFISLQRLEFSGHGQPMLNPYLLISGGLYTDCNIPPRMGNERGIATPYSEEIHVGFSGVDFGSPGSDKITLWLFPLSNEPFDFEIWEGMPNDGGEKLLTAHYDKGSIWNTYIEVQYTLPKRLTGIKTVCLVFYDKVHIKGFSFDNID